MLVGPISGYSTQAGVSLEVAHIINNGRIRFWFAREFNPIHNLPASRPLHIFEELDRAAKTGDHGSEKALSIADNLRAWVARWEAEARIDRDVQARALQEIKTAFDDAGFVPHLFYLHDLPGVMKEDQPDEYRVENYPISDSTVRRIIPAHEDS